MATQGFLARVAGKTKQIFATTTSAGAADAGKIPALDGAGRFDMSMMPLGIGANTTQATASEAMKPFAPPRLSTTMGWPRSAAIGSVSSRVVTSVPLPAGKATMARIGRSGQAPWARAVWQG